MSSLGGMPWEGHPQGVPLPIVFSRRYALGRAPTRGAPTNCLLSAVCPGKGTHKGRPYRLSSLGGMPWEGHPQGAPFYRLSSLGGMPWEGHPQGVPLPIVFSRRYALGRAHTRGALLPIVFSRRYALGRAPTRGAPTNCLLSAVCPGKGTHKGRPYRLSSLGGMPWEGHPQGAPFYRLSSLGGMPWEGHPQGVPLPIVFSRRYALGRAPTRGALLPIVFSRRYALGRAPTRGAPTDCLLSAVCPGKGTHKGRPYRLSSLGGMPWEGHPQGVPLPIVFSRRYALGRAPTRGAPTNCLLSAVCPGKGTHKGRPYCLLSAVCPGKGTHKGCPYQLSSLGGMPWEGHPQGAPLPDCLLSAVCPGKGTHKGCPYQLSSLGGMPWEGHPQGAPLPIVFSRRYALGRAPTRGALLPIVFSRRYSLKRAPTRGAPTRFRQPHVGLSQFDAIALDTSTVHSLLA